MKSTNIPFMKFSGAGNDFIAIDNYDGKIKLTKTQIMNICRRRFSIGADGLMMLEKAPKKGYDFYMRFYNNDGREAEMCGNAARCIARFAYTIGRSGLFVKFLAKDGPHTAEIKTNGDVKLEMIEPFGMKQDISVNIKGKIYKGNYINTGVPHFVTHAGAINKMDIVEPGRAIRLHKKFAPKGTNVMFIKKLKDNDYVIRSYERGVEGETLACGTGATAAGVLLHADGKAKSPVKFRAPGGTLKIYFKEKNGKYTDVYLEGNARLISAGYILQEALR